MNIMRTYLMALFAIAGCSTPTETIDKKSVATFVKTKDGQYEAPINLDYLPSGWFLSLDHQINPGNAAPCSVKIQIINDSEKNVSVNCHKIPYDQNKNIESTIQKGASIVIFEGDMLEFSKQWSLRVYSITGDNISVHMLITVDPVGGPFQYTVNAKSMDGP